MTNNTQLSITNFVKGNAALYSHNGMRFVVELIDARKVYGRVDVLIHPHNGEGEKWVEASSITVIE